MRDFDFLHDIPLNENRWDDLYWIAVVGSRDYTDVNAIYTNLKYLTDKLIEHGVIKCLTDVVIISGKAKGVDSIGRQFGIDNDMTTINILPDWDQYNKRAGFLRNENIIRHANRVVAFRLNNSRGTSNSIQHAVTYGIPCHTIDI